MLIEEVYLWSGSTDVWMRSKELEKGSRSALLYADNYRVRKSLMDTVDFRRRGVSKRPVLVDGGQ